MAKIANKYNLRHISCNMQDFYSDCHRFRFEYEGEEKIATCYHALSVFFEDENLPENVRSEVVEMIYDKIDREESRWRYPEKAYQIADAYCRENFKAKCS